MNTTMWYIGFELDQEVCMWDGPMSSSITHYGAGKNWNNIVTNGNICVF